MQSRKNLTLKNRSRVTKSGFNNDTNATPTSMSLHFDSKDPSHFEKWRRYMVTETSKTYGRLSTIFINDSYPPETPLPNVPNENYTDKNDPGGIKRELLKQTIADKVKKDSLMNDNKPKLFGSIIQSLSQTSLMVVQRRVSEIANTDNFLQKRSVNQERPETRQDNDDNDNEEEEPDKTSDYDDEFYQELESFQSRWNEFEAQADPLLLWNVIKVTHQTSRTSSSRLDKEKATQVYYTMKQGMLEKIDPYKLRFDNTLTTMTAVGLNLPAMSQIVTRFIESLNADYDKLKDDIKNREFSGDTYAWPKISTQRISSLQSSCVQPL